MNSISNQTYINTWLYTTIVMVVLMILIGGITRLGDSTFVGLGASIGNEIQIGKKCMIGAQTLVTKSLDDKSVLIKEPTKPHRLNSDQFTRMSACFRVNV